MYLKWLLGFFLKLVVQVELELGVNSDGKNYCVSKGEQLALNVDGAEYTHGPQGRFFKR